MDVAIEQCRYRDGYGRCQQARGHRGQVGDRGHEIHFDGTVVFRWRPGFAAWIALPGGIPIRDLTPADA